MEFIKNLNLKIVTNGVHDEYCSYKCEALLQHSRFCDDCFIFKATLARNVIHGPPLRCKECFKECKEED
jgi:hypothetical protein